MCNWCKLLAILWFSGLAQGVYQHVSTSIPSQVVTVCNDTVFQELDKCWDKLPPVNHHGIPSNPKEIVQACRILATGMDCVNNWSRLCSSEIGLNKIESSIMGAIQIYKILCSDIKFRKEYLKHATCYLRISPIWDNCNHKFIDTLTRIHNTGESLDLCCIRLSYVQCIDDVTTTHCSYAATKFLHSITKSLSDSPEQVNHSSQCNNVDKQMCSNSASAKSSSKFLLIPLDSTCIPICSGTLNFFQQWIFAFLSLFLTMAHNLDLNR